MLMKGFFLAAASALCALGSLASGAAGIILMFLDARLGLALFAAMLLLGGSAKLFDRRKMRAIAGQPLGDLLHDADLLDPELLGISRHRLMPPAAADKRPSKAPARPAELVGATAHMGGGHD